MVKTSETAPAAVQNMIRLSRFMFDRSDFLKLVLEVFQSPLPSLLSRGWMWKKGQRSEILADTEIYLPLTLIAGFLERDADVDSNRTDRGVVTECGAGGKLKIVNGYVIGVGGKLAEIHKDRTG